MHEVTIICALCMLLFADIQWYPVLPTTPEDIKNKPEEGPHCAYPTGPTAMLYRSCMPPVRYCLIACCTSVASQYRPGTPGISFTAVAASQAPVREA